MTVPNFVARAVISLAVEEDTVALVDIRFQDDQTKAWRSVADLDAAFPWKVVIDRRWLDTDDLRLWFVRRLMLPARYTCFYDTFYFSDQHEAALFKTFFA